MAAAVGLVLWLALRDAVAGASASIWLGGSLAVVLLLWCLARAYREGDFTIQMLAFWNSIYLSTALVVGGVSGREWTDCRIEFGKCTAVGRLYTGPFESENTLGMVSAATIGLVLASGLKWKKALPPVAVLSLIVALTGSRSPIVVMLVAIVGGVGMQVLAAERSEGWRQRAFPTWTISILAPLTGIWVVYRFRGPTLSNRGLVWEAITRYMGGPSILGLGEEQYRVVGATGLFRYHYPHSQYLQLVFFGGLAALFLYSLLLRGVLSSITARTRPQFIVRTATCLYFAAYGFTDLTWGPTHIDHNTWTIVALLVLAGGDARRRIIQGPTNRSALGNASGRGGSVGRRAGATGGFRPSSQPPPMAGVGSSAASTTSPDDLLETRTHAPISDATWSVE